MSSFEISSYICRENSTYAATYFRGGLPFARDPKFNLEDHAARAFGSFQSDEEFSYVVWRFKPEAAIVAREFVFHPLQELEQESDGSLLVKFQASGYLEMTWHLYCWGDAVEVVEPPQLRQMVHRHRRSDFGSFP